MQYSGQHVSPGMVGPEQWGRLFLVLLVLCMRNAEDGDEPLSLATGALPTGILCPGVVCLGIVCWSKNEGVCSEHAGSTHLSRIGYILTLGLLALLHLDIELTVLSNISAVPFWQVSRADNVIDICLLEAAHLVERGISRAMPTFADLISCSDSVPI